MNGTVPKKVLIRARGPSLASSGIGNSLANPQLELHNSTDIIARNDDWQVTQVGGVVTSDQTTEIQNSTLAPQNPAEPALIVTLPPGNYTAIVQGTNAGTGVATVEVYVLTPDTAARLLNISTRGFVQTQDNVMIGGLIVLNQPAKVLIRARGPSLTSAGITNPLVDPQLELHDSATTIARNGDWQTTQTGGLITGDQAAEIQNSTLAPGNAAEPAMIVTLAPGNYTAIVQGANGGTGVGTVEVYLLQ